MKLSLDRPWLVADLGAALRVLSWSLTKPGFVEARRIVWREVRNADLPEDLDAEAWLRAELAAAGHAEAVAFLTSRDIRRVSHMSHEVEGVWAETVATVGLSNAERVGHRRTHPQGPGTINIALQLSAPMTDAALIEALSIAVEARTTAVLEHGPRVAAGPATGTGTDCVAVAAPAGDLQHAGKHTAIGEAAGRAVLDAVTRGVQEWMQEQGD
ncbi:MAG: adenosylcobinamide amidohydrolase [Pseudomonadota bacterium]